MSTRRNVDAMTLSLGLGLAACGQPNAPVGLDEDPQACAACSDGFTSDPAATDTDPSSESGDPGRDDSQPQPVGPDLGTWPTVPSPPGFTDVTGSAGLHLDPGAPSIPPWCILDDVEDPDQGGDFCIPERFLGAAAAADYDGDGFADLYLTTLRGPDRLMHNQGDGTFVDVTAHAGLHHPHATGGVAWVDVDGDADLDLMVTGVGSPRNYLYLNDGQGHFEERGHERGVAVHTGRPHVGMGIGVGDYDLDGWLDLFVSDWHPQDPLGNAADHNRLLHNLGAQAPGYFEDVTETMGIDLPALAPIVDAKAGSYGFAPAFVDLDDDGWPELTLTADFGTSRLWWNEGGVLVDRTFASGVGTERNGMGSTFGDYDGDGDLDWFVAAISTPDFPSLGNRMYRNDGQRQFTDVTDALGLRNGGWGWGASMFDMDLDGDLDLAMAAGWTSTRFSADPVRMWINDDPAGPWTDHSEALGVVLPGQGRGLLPLDYDRDGDLDLLVLANTEAPMLFRNDMARGDWLTVEVRGLPGNPRSLGATVRVQAVPEGPVRVRHIGVGSHLFGQGEAIAHFGLPPADAPLHRVEVSWPASGRHQIHAAVPRDQPLVVYE